MKRILLCSVAVLSVAAQTVLAQTALESQFSIRRGKTGESPGETKANEIAKGSVVYSGIVVEAIKSPNLLQLINPLAPARYGTAQDNTIEDPTTGKPRGWKLFSLRF